MATAVNPASATCISIGNAVGSVAEWLRQFTVRVLGAQNSHGSGVIWNCDGLIVTNAHVANSQVHDVELADGRRLQGWVVARDRKMDLAALALSAKGLPAASIRGADTLRAGEMLIAVGNPWDGVGAVSTGVVHRRIGAQPWIAADIRLVPGNSGGPLADAQGNVVGVNAMVVNGFGCAITSNAVEEFLRRARLTETA